MLYPGLIKTPTLVLRLVLRKVADGKSVSSFEEIKGFLHFSANAYRNKYDPQRNRLQKIRQLVKKLREKLYKMPREENHFVDVQIVQFMFFFNICFVYYFFLCYKWITFLSYANALVALF